MVKTTRTRRLLFTLAAVALAIVVPVGTLLAIDVYLHGRFQKSAGFNVWGYRGPIVGRKQSGELRAVVLGGSTAFGYGVRWDQTIPWYLQEKLRARLRSGPKATVVNLAYNAEGAYSFKFTLKDYAYLNYDTVLIYEGYNDVNWVDLAVFRHDSPMFRLTGYLPIFPIVFKEKAAAMLHGGDVGALYRTESAPGRTVFRPGLATRATAEALTTAAAISESVERQLGKVTAEPRRQVDAPSTSGCHRPWGEYCRSVFDAVDYALSTGKRIIVVTEPYGGEEHVDQQRTMSTALLEKYKGNNRVAYVNLGPVIDLHNRAHAYDGMHLTALGNEMIADHLVDPVLAISGRQ